MDEDIRVTWAQGGAVDLVRVWVVGGQDLVTEALAARLALAPDLWVVGRCAADDLRRLGGQRPDVVVYDPADGEVEAVLTAAAPDAALVALSSVREPGRAVAAARAGVASWVPTTEGVDYLIRVVRGVRLDHSWWPPDLLGHVLAALRDDGAGPLAALSAREREVLGHLVDGLRGPEIASAMSISPNTVRTHTHSAYSKLGVHSRLQAVRVARAAGVTPRERNPRQMT